MVLAMTIGSSVHGTAVLDVVVLGAALSEKHDTAVCTETPSRDVR
jgi:hypothetical protein